MREKSRIIKNRFTCLDAIYNCEYNEYRKSQTIIKEIQRPVFCFKFT